MGGSAAAAWLAVTAMVLGLAGCDDPLRPEPPCGTASVTRPTSLAPPPLAPPSSTSSVPAPEGLQSFDGHWVVEGAAGAELAGIEVKQEVAQIRFGGKTVKGTLRGGARRYVLEGQPGYVAKVKRRGARIELRDEEGRALTLAFIRDEVIRFSARDDSGAAGFASYFVTPQAGGGYVLKRQAVNTGPKVVVGTVTHDGSTKRMVVRNATGAKLFRGVSERPSALWAVLLADELDELTRYILMAELGVRGR